MSTTSVERSDPDGATDDEQRQLYVEPPEPFGKKAARLINEAGIFIAPVIIALLAFLLYLYYQSLDLANADISQRSALNWDNKLVPQLQEILTIAALSTLLVTVVAVPLGIILTRPIMRRSAPYIITVANSGQAIPAYGLLVIGLIVAGQGLATTVYVLAIFALLPVLRNTMVGLDAVDRNVIEAGRGMGMTKIQALTRIELPIAVPIITAGIRTAVIINIGMATLAFLIGGGGLGITINSGIKLNENPVLIVGAALVALTALTFDWIGALLERYLKPKGL